MEESKITKELENQPNAAVVEAAEVKFRCPQCGENTLIALGVWGNEIKLFMNGELDWGDVVAYGGEPYLCCAACGFELHDEQGCRISHLGGVVRWLLGRHVEKLIEKL